MTVAAIFNEGRLKRRLYTGDFGEIDIAAQLLFAGRFKVEFLNSVAAQNHHPGFFRMG